LSLPGNSQGTGKITGEFAQKGLKIFKLCPKFANFAFGTGNNREFMVLTTSVPNTGTYGAVGFR
jgi:hypothetical protein